MQVIRDKFDIVDLAYKGKLVGAKIHLADGRIRPVANFYCDWAIQMINVVFADAYVGEPASQFSFKSKFTVTIDESYFPIKSSKIEKQK